MSRFLPNGLSQQFALPLTRRQWLAMTLGAAANFAFGVPVEARSTFEAWVKAFRARALRSGITADTYARVMYSIKPDNDVFEFNRYQPEFKVPMWQYINRRCSEWRVTTGRERVKEYAGLFERIERDYGVERYGLAGLWGMESSFGDVIGNPKYMRPIIPALATLAWGEPRRRRYWQQELINALRIVDRGWSKPDEMVGSWAGAMGHTQWMPEVWLNVGVDYDKDGRIHPFGNPADALAGTAQYLTKRGRYQRGEHWGYEAKVPDNRTRLADKRTWRTYAQWQKLGIARADGKSFPRPDDRVRLWIPVSGGPGFLIGQNFYAYRSYNPSDSYTLALVHLGDLIRDDSFHFIQQFPGGERIPTTEEVKEIQRRLTEKGFVTDGVDGRSGRDTVNAIRAYQKKVGMEPDGYAGLKLLERLRQGS